MGQGENLSIVQFRWAEAQDSSNLIGENKICIVFYFEFSDK